MSNPTCNSTLAESNPGFGLQGLNDRQYEAAEIYFMVRELAANGGTDYSNVMTSTLISDAVTFIGRMDRNQRRIAMLNILYNNAVSAGSDVPDNPSTLNALTSCCFQSEPVDFDAIKLMLLCKLGRHADYPQ